MKAKLLGVLLTWIGLLASISIGGTALLTAMLIRTNGTPLDYLILAAAISLSLIARNAFRAGRRMTQDSASERMAKDKRPAVLLLRAFKSDGEIAEENWLRQRSLLGILLGRETFEEEVARILEGLGPAVALGRSGEILPTLGFAKEYAQMHNWREMVLEYLERAGWVIFVLHNITPNLTY